MADIYEFHLKITGPDPERKVVLTTGITTIGRQQGNDIQLDNSQVSRSHARFECTLTECWLTDLGSSNGTRLDGTKLTPNVPVQVKDNPLIKIGPFELVVESVAVEAPLSEGQTLDDGNPVIPEPSTAHQEELPGAGQEVAIEPQDLDQASVPPPPVDLKRPIQLPVEDGSGHLPGNGSGGLPPDGPVPPQAGLDELPFGADGLFPPGLGIESRHLIQYLPGIYATDFMVRFLGIFEAILMPIEWTVDNFDLFLDPGTAPAGFLPWLENWFGLVWKSAWSEEKRRALLIEAHQIYARRGTRWSLSRMLEIYTGAAPEIIDDTANLAPFTFIVKIPLPAKQVNQDVVRALINANKPAYTTYQLEFRP